MRAEVVAAGRGLVVGDEGRIGRKERRGHGREDGVRREGKGMRG